MDFNIGDVVLVFFESIVLSGEIVGKCKRAQSFKVDLDTDLYDDTIIVSHRVLEHDNASFCQNNDE